MTRDCDTCQMHVQGKPVSRLCEVSCLAFKDLPMWVAKKETMEHPYDATFRDTHEGLLPGPIPAKEHRISMPPELALTCRIGEPEKPPLNTQVGGTHYKGFKIQPIEFAMVNNLDACQAKVLKYVCRKKGDKAKRMEDLDKAIHVIQLYKQLITEGKAE